MPTGFGGPDSVRPPRVRRRLTLGFGVEECRPALIQANLPKRTHNAPREGRTRVRPPESGKHPTGSGTLPKTCVRLILGRMRPSLWSRAGLVCLLLLGFSLEAMIPVALEPDHYMEHSSSAQQATEARVSLHSEDGDHHHETARIELGEKGRHAHCGLCAQFGKSRALLIKQLGLAATLDLRHAVLADSVFLSSLVGTGPLQPRAPPRV